MINIMVFNYISSEAHITFRSFAQIDCAFSVADLSVLIMKLQKSLYNLDQLPKYEFNSNEEYTCKKF